MRKIICLTPVKNEAWIIDKFITAASQWADHIIIADQGSEDDTLNLASRFEKVTLINNSSSEYDEEKRQALLLSEARKIEGDNNIFIALDADEFLVNYHENGDLKALEIAEPGTTVWFSWINLLPGGATYYEAKGGKTLFGYVNDGKTHKGKQIHSYRVPFDTESPQITLANVKVLHLQYAFPDRLLSKHRWYECLEKIKFPDKNNIDIYRQYHHIDLPVHNIEKLNESWMVPLKGANLHVQDIKDNGMYWWDKDVFTFFKTYGVKKFARVAIWYVDWNRLHKELYSDQATFNIKDPRTILDKIIHYWLKISQSNRFSFFNKVINKLLRIINW